MAMDNSAYVHVLLFRCKRCNAPLVVPVLSEGANLEKIDGNTYEVHCSCGWSKKLLGIEAARHWVSPWEQTKDTGRLGDRPDDIGLFN
jgi:hypothetical protein